MRLELWQENLLEDYFFTSGLLSGIAIIEQKFHLPLEIKSCFLQVESWHGSSHNSQSERHENDGKERQDYSSHSKPLQLDM